MGISKAVPLRGEAWSQARRILAAPDTEPALVAHAVLDALRGQGQELLGSEAYASGLALALDAAGSLANRDEARMAEYVSDLDEGRYLLFVSNVVGAAKDELSSGGKNSIFSEIATQSLSRSLTDLVVSEDADLGLSVRDAAAKLADVGRSGVLNSLVAGFVADVVGGCVHHFSGREWQKVAGSFALPTPTARDDLQQAVSALCRRSVENSGALAAFAGALEQGAMAQEEIAGALREAIPAVLSEVERIVT